MWIKRVTFENFINFYVGLGRKRVSLDFSSRENVMCLIVGPNGVGKTSLLSYLTPFATVGNLDIRDGNSLILKDKKGYKRIIIMDGEIEYDIEHFYTPTTKGHTIKSYFKRDGVELNENGNVTSFKELVTEFFHIDMEYLKLIRIGDNVSNLIKLKAAERKNFMSKFLASTDMYLKYYKKISADVRDISALMSHTNDKLRKLAIDDRAVFLAEIGEQKKGVKFLDRELETLTGSISTLSFQMTKVLESSHADTIENLIQEQKKLCSLLKKWEKALEKKNAPSAKKLEKNLQEMEKEYNQIIGECSGLTVSKTSNLEVLDGLYKDLTILKKEYAFEVSESKIDSLEEYICKLHDKRKLAENTLPSTKPKIAKDTLEEFIVAIKNIQNILNTTYDFGREPIREAVTILEKNGSIDRYVAGKLVAIEKANVTEKTYLDKLVDKYSRIKRPEGCNCSLLSLYDDLMLVKDMKAEDPNKARSAEYYQMVSAVYENIERCIQDLSRYVESIKELPANIAGEFTKKKVFEHIRDCEFIYPEKLLNKLLSDVTEFYNYEKILEELEIACRDLQTEKSKSNLEFYEKRITETENKIHTFQENRDIINEELRKRESWKKELEEKIEDTKTLIDAVTKFESTKEEEAEVGKQIQLFQTLEKKFKDTMEKRKAREADKRLLNQSVQEKETRLAEYDRLVKDLGNAEEMYDDLVAIKTSTSNTKGIPLLYINLYLEDVVDIANDLLEIVYHGDLYIEKFDITESTFLIPYVKKGRVIGDISFASQGEQSFLSMAISFALGAKNMTEYNIPLLDEVDGVFDEANREHCIPIIEKENDIIRCEQEFIISHNNMYKQYPVDVLDIGNLQSSKFFVDD